MAFYVLARKSQSEYGSEYDTEFLAAEDARYGEAPRCPVCGEFTGMRQRLPPFRVELELQDSSATSSRALAAATSSSHRGLRRSIDHMV
jgi:hypothetical protein